jgi:hypothetical protein
MVGYPPCQSDMSGSFPVADKHRFRICRSRLRQERPPPGGNRSQRTHLGISITQLNRDVPHELVLESDGHDSRYRFYYGRFSVCDMTDRACSRVNE